MESIRGYLDVGSLYRLHDQDGDRSNEPCLECIKCITDDAYDRHAALVRSTVTGWTMVIHGTNIYEDGSIDWDFRPAVTGRIKMKTVFCMKGEYFHDF